MICGGVLHRFADALYRIRTMDFDGNDAESVSSAAEPGLISSIRAHNPLTAVPHGRITITKPDRRPLNDDRRHADDRGTADD
jgi:hypothetical protein